MGSNAIWSLDDSLNERAASGDGLGRSRILLYHKLAFISPTVAVSPQTSNPSFHLFHATICRCHFSFVFISQKIKLSLHLPLNVRPRLRWSLHDDWLEFGCPSDCGQLPIVIATGLDMLICYGPSLDPLHWRGFLLVLHHNSDLHWNRYRRGTFESTAKQRHWKHDDAEDPVCRYSCCKQNGPPSCLTGIMSFGFALSIISLTVSLDFI